MALQEFFAGGGDSVHPSYRDSILAPVAPEYATGEVLLGATYRKLLLGVSEASIDLSRINALAGYLDPADAWQDLLRTPGGLGSPPLGGQGSNPPPQLMPLVPEIGRYAAVLGERPRRRWEPGNLLLSALASAHGPASADAAVSRLRAAAAVDDTDDILARFIQDALQQATQRGAAPPAASSTDGPPAPEYNEPAWRSGRQGQRTPAERFAIDLDTVLELKARLTRRQWTVLLEALLRLGLGTHVLWLCRLNSRTWNLALAAAEAGQPPSRQEVEEECWSAHAGPDPLLELGRDGLSSIRKRLQDYVQARIGINLLLYAMDDAGCSWRPIGVPESGSADDPLASLASFFDHVATNGGSVTQVVRGATDGGSLRESAGRIADANPRALAAQSGPAKNLWEYLRYCLGQLQPHEDELKSYDQAYLLYRAARTSSVWPVQPEPACLIMMVHACCRSLGGIPSSMDDFGDFLGEYGIVVPPGELQEGRTSLDLERLGLVVDSPDARGGRLLVDPF